ncbi:MAG: DUF309 domain-containing protein [Chlorobi bacterium]|nr:DUF309 domain-containing protein [Chlorobiota bacterium]
MYFIDEGIKLFNDSDFFAAHDFFEDIWTEAESEDKLFFQGLVQISVGSYHLICGNYSGSESQLRKGEEKLERYLPAFLNVNVEDLLRNIRKIISALKAREKPDENKAVDLLDFQIKFIN